MDTRLYFSLEQHITLNAIFYSNCNARIRPVYPAACTRRASAETRGFGSGAARSIACHKCRQTRRRSWLARSMGTPPPGGCSVLRDHIVRLHRGAELLAIRHSQLHAHHSRQPYAAHRSPSKEEESRLPGCVMAGEVKALNTRRKGLHRSGIRSIAAISLQMVWATSGKVVNRRRQ